MTGGGKAGNDTGGSNAKAGMGGKGGGTGGTEPVTGGAAGSGAGGDGMSGAPGGGSGAGGDGIGGAPGGGEGGSGGDATSGGVPGGGEGGAATAGSGNEGGSGGACSATDLIVDGGFEINDAAAWDQSSTNFVTPLCTELGCGLGETGPAAGDAWIWFGGTDEDAETGTVSQDVVIPSGGAATLRFMFAAPSCDSSASDTFVVTVDGGNPLFSATNLSPLCDVNSYSLQTIDVSSFADGDSHKIEFRADTNDFIVATNFMLDEVELIVCD